MLRYDDSRYLNRPDYRPQPSVRRAPEAVVRQVSFGWRHRAQGLIESLPEYLAWSGRTGVVRAAVELSDAWTWKRLHTWQESQRTPIQSRVEVLPSAARERLFRSPRLNQLLRSAKIPNPVHLEGFDNFVAFEEYLCGMNSTVPLGRWSALGDYFADDAWIGAKGCSPTEAAGTSRIDGILVDSISPNVSQSWMLPGLGELGCHTAEEFALVSKRVSSSLQRIESLQPAAADMIRSVVAVIATGKSARSPDLTASVSARKIIGISALANLQSPEWSAEGICTSLVHEAVHSLIYRVELVECVYADPQAAFVLQVQSPWSGRLLELHSFFHACFVWFAIWNFWRSAGAGASGSLVEALRAKRGFISADMNALFSSPAIAALKPYARETLEHMFQLVREQSGSEL
jgi:hypothetical protein